MVRTRVPSANAQASLELWRNWFNYNNPNKPPNPGLILVIMGQWFYEMSHIMTKPTKWPVHPAKTQISLGMQHNKTTCAPSEDSDQPGHPPSLNRVFTVHIKKHYSQHEIFWHLSDRLKFPAGQYENLLDRKKSSASVYHNILFINWIECPKALNGGPFSPKAVSLMTVLKFHRQTEISCMTNWFVRQSGSFRIDCIEHIEKTDQTGQMPRLIWVFVGHTSFLLVLSYGGSDLKKICQRKGNSIRPKK